jgi:acyl carrier protein
MGLDGIELVMSLEEALGVQITDEEATNCRTPRMMIDMIFAKLKTVDEHVCRSQRAFYTIRGVLVQTFGLERKSITPDLRLRDFIPQTREKVLWEQMRATLMPRGWPPLVLPRWMVQLIAAICLVVFLAAAAIVMYSSRRIGSALVLGVICATSVGIMGAVTTRPFRTLIPPRFQSIRDVIPYAITSDRMNRWTRDEVAAVVKRIVIDQLALAESAYTEDARFVEDWKAGR